MIKLAINGFGRIGRTTFRTAFNNSDIEIVAINDLADAKTMAHLLVYDSVYGIYSKNVKVKNENEIFVDGKSINVFTEKDPKKLPWKELGIDVVIESTGVFTNEDGVKQHIDAGAKKVVLSAPAKEGKVSTYVLGVNDDKYDNEKYVSNASCTTNCIAPVMAIMNESFGVKKALMTTVHAYTADQNLQDGPHKDLRRARAAAYNIVPTTTGAAIAATKAIPELEGRFDGIAVRVPVIDASISDIVMLINKKTTVDEINRVFKEATNKPKYKNIVAATNEPIVSSDIIGNSHSTIIDLSLTKVMDGDFVKIVAWYDNEWAYCKRMVETAIKISK